MVGRWQAVYATLLTVSRTPRGSETLNVKGYTLQHFVPQFYLRRFTGQDGLLWVYDKDTDRIFSSTPRNLAAERGFYALPVGFPDPLLLESQLSDLEEQAALITEEWLNQLASGNSVDIPDINREIMSLYFTIQLLRTSEARTLFIQGIESPEITSGDDEVHRAAHIALLWNDKIVDEISTWIHSCTWTFRMNAKSKSLYTSDDPVKVRSSTRHLTWAQTSERGAYLITPLTPRILMYCFEPQWWSTLKRFDCQMVPAPLEDRLVTDANTQQVAHARRFVFSDREDFSLARDFCATYPGAVGQNRGRFEHSDPSHIEPSN